MSTGSLRRHREALQKLREEEADQEIAEVVVVGTYACPICGVDTPHTHTPEPASAPEPAPEPEPFSEPEPEAPAPTQRKRKPQTEE